MSTTETTVDNARLANIGREVPLGSGKVRIRELSFEKTLEMAGPIIELIQLSATLTASGKVDGMSWFVAIMKRPETVVAYRMLLAAATGEPAARFENLTLTEGLRLIVAVKEVFNWEELRELFFQIAPPSLVNALSGAVGTK